MTKQKQDKLNKILDKLTQHDEKFNKIDKRFDKIEDGLNEQAKRFLGLDDKFGEIKAEINNKFDKVLTGQDKIMGELERAREDRKLTKKKDDEQDQRLRVLEKSCA